MARDVIQKRELTKAFKGRHDVLFVPHYRTSGLYVGPGGKHYTMAQLVAGGASVVSMMLWPRGDA
jgi:hypothetical protein